MIEEIRSQLVNKKFKNTQVNIKGLYLYSKVSDEEIKLVELVDFNAGGVTSYDQYFSVKNQIYRNFQERNHKKIVVQTLLFTNQIESVKEIAINDWDAWIVDTNNLNLIVYENQRSDFDFIRKDIEDILSMKRSNDYFNNSSQNITAHAHAHAHNQAYDRKNDNSSIFKSFVSTYFTKVNTFIVLINVIVFFVSDKFLFGVGLDKISDIGALYWPSVFYNKEYYRLFTYMFLHGGINHLVNNMIILLFIGDNLERAVGKLKYLAIYFGSGILAGVASSVYNMLKNVGVVSVGASGAIFGIVGALAYIVIINKGRLENISTRQIVLFVFLSLYGGFTSQGVDNVAHVAGLLAGALLGILLYRKRKRREPEGGY